MPRRNNRMGSGTDPRRMVALEDEMRPDWQRRLESREVDDTRRRYDRLRERITPGGSR